MPHIHDLIDFVVSVYIVNKNKVLLVHHKQLNKWLPIGGHIELHEDTDEAVVREVREETGLKVKIHSTKPRMRTPGTKFLYTPRFANIHKIKGEHRHLTMIYFATSKSGGIKHNKEEHNQIRWFTKEELKKIKIKNSVYFYAVAALKELGN